MTDIDDLQRVLGYVDAVDDSAPIEAVGPDLYVASFWTPQFCAAIVREFAGRIDETRLDAVTEQGVPAGDPPPGPSTVGGEGAARR